MLIKKQEINVYSNIHQEPLLLTKHKYIEDNMSLNMKFSKFEEYFDLFMYSKVKNNIKLPKIKNSEVEPIDFCFNDKAFNLINPSEEKELIELDKINPTDGGVKIFDLDIYCNDTQSLLSVNSDTSQLTKQIRKLKNSIFSKKRPKEYNNIISRLAICSFILLSSMIFYFIYPASLKNEYDQIVNALINFNSITSSLACIHNYARNSYLIDNQFYHFDRHNYYNSSYMNFSQLRIRNCSEDMNNIAYILDRTFTKDDSNFPTNSTFYEYNKGKLKVIEKELYIQAGFQFILHSTLNLARHDTEIKNKFSNDFYSYLKANSSERIDLSNDYNRLFTNTLNEFYILNNYIIQNSYNLLITFSDSLFNSTIISLSIIILILVICLLIFSFSYNIKTRIEINIYNIIYDYSNFLSIKDKYNRLTKLIFNIISNSKDKLNYSINDYENDIDLDVINNDLPKNKSRKANKAYRALELKKSLEIKKKREIYINKGISYKISSNRKSYFIFSLIFIIIFSAYFLFIFLLTLFDTKSSYNHFQINLRLNSYFTKSMLSFIFLKENILTNMYNDTTYPFTFQSTPASNISIHDYITESNEVLNVIKMETFTDDKVKDLWNNIINGNICDMYFKSEVDLNYKCLSIGNGILKTGFANGLSYYLQNINQLSSNLLDNTYDYTLYVESEQLMDLFLRSSFEDFVHKFNMVYKTRLNNEQTVIRIVFIIYVFVLIAFLLIVSFCWLDSTRKIFSNALMIVCILPNSCLGNPNLLSNIQILNMD